MSRGRLFEMLCLLLERGRMTAGEPFDQLLSPPPVENGWAGAAPAAAAGPAGRKNGGAPQKP